MKKILIAFAGIAAIVTGIILITPDKPIEINNLFTEHQEVTTLARMERDTLLKKKKKLDINKEVLKKIKKDKSDSLTIVIDGHKLKMKKVHIHPKVFTLPDSAEVVYEEGLFYHGIVDDSGVATITVLDSTVEIMYSKKGEGNNFISPQDDSHIQYNDTDIIPKNPFKCDELKVPDSLRPPQQQKLIEASPTDKCLHWYWESKFQLFANKGSLAATANFLTDLFNKVQPLYAKYGVTVILNELYIWTVPDVYPTTSSSTDNLYSFGANRTSYNGDGATLLGFGGGGVSWVGTNCFNVLKYKQNYCGIDATLSAWSVEVVSHEGGHLYGGLSHSHACVFTINGVANQRIDNCAGHASLSYQEGTCNDVPDPIGGGVIMSYCHLRPCGINFAEGFGDLQGNMMRNTINSANCLSTCTPTNCTPSTKTDTIKNCGTNKVGYYVLRTKIDSACKTVIDTLVNTCKDSCTVHVEKEVIGCTPPDTGHIIRQRTWTNCIAAKWDTISKTCTVQLCLYDMKASITKALVSQGIKLLANGVLTSRNYKWNTGATTQFIILPAATHGTYSVTVGSNYPYPCLKNNTKSITF